MGVALMQPTVWGAKEMNIVNAITAEFGTQVLSDATTQHVKNATYTELFAATADDAYAIEVRAGGSSALSTVNSVLIDIAIGGVGSETVIIPNLNCGAPRDCKPGSATCGGQRYFFPLYIPAGSRVSATCQSNQVAGGPKLIVSLYERPSGVIPWAGSMVTDYGTNLSLSRGVSVTYGLSGAEGTFTEIVSATTLPHRYLAIGVGLDADTTVQGANYFVDAGVGAASESVIIENGMMSTGTGENIDYGDFIGAYCDIPAGSRLAARISKGAGTAGSMDVQLYGVS